MDKYGKIKLKIIDNSNDFWTLYDELCKDKSYLIKERDELLEAFKNNKLYGLEVKETLDMYNRDDRYDNIFAKSYNIKKSNYLLPCFCLKNENIAIILWVHTRARRMGIGRILLKLLSINYVLKPILESKEFWEKCNIKSLNFL